MASDPSVPVNGNYAAHASYALPDQNYSSHAVSSTGAASADYSGTANAPNLASEGNGAKTDIPKDEVGWYFVEQYYTNLGKSPEKLYLFYTRQSQFVSGDEAQKVPVSVGQKSIKERIKELGFHDARVRVSNVDSQGSGANIVIQVIGDISNNSQPHRKFTQTFVLAEQTNGYFVLNDIFRYIVDEEDMPLDEVPNLGAETQGDTAATDIQDATHEPPNAADVGVQEMDATAVDPDLSKHVDEPTPAEDPLEANVNGDGSPQVPESIANEDLPETAEGQEETAAEAVSTSEAIEIVAPETVIQSETPKAPEPTPIASSIAPVQPAAVAQSAKPAIPRTWAALAAGANRTASPAAATSSTAPTSTTSSRVAAPPLTQPQAIAAPASQSADPESPITPQAGSEWQTAGHDHGKRQARPQATTSTGEENYKGYIKHVSEHIEVQALKTALSKAAEVSYVDINRQKNCAFVDFASPAAYRAAVAANPHDVSGEQIYVEERRIRPQGYTGTYGPNRGGAGRGRGGGPDARGGSQGRGGGFSRDGARGGFSSRGRGGNGNGNARGRGVSSTT